MSRMIQTNMGEMPLQDYLDIRALECGFDSYKELEEAGFSIEIPEISKEKENNHHSPRKHLRAAHWHTYLYGPSKKLRKVLWVAATWVGAGDEEIDVIHTTT